MESEGRIYITEGRKDYASKRYIIRIYSPSFIIKYIEGAKFLFWSVKSWCLRSKHIDLPRSLFRVLVNFFISL